MDRFSYCRLSNQNEQRSAGREIWMLKSAGHHNTELVKRLWEEIGQALGYHYEAAMIGAMPAVAVRHERRRQEKRNKRPSLLYLQSPHSRSATPSPLQSPPASHQFPPEIYVCGKVSVLHIVVVSLLLGAVLLIVGLVQLKPGADASQHRYVLLGSGAFLLVVGVALAVVRCCLLPWKGRHEPVAHIPEAPNPAPLNPSTATPGSRRDSVGTKRGSVTKRGSSVEFEALPPPAKIHETCETQTS